MFFAGNCISGYKNSGEYFKTNLSNSNTVSIDGGVFDKVSISKNTNSDFNVDEWDYDTVLIADFSNSLAAGNIQFLLDQVSAIRIKRRKKGTYKWITLHEKPVSSQQDVIFDYYDRFAANDTEYEYCAVPVVYGAEGNIEINTIKSEFDGIYIVGADSSFHTILDIEKSTITRNEITNVITTLKGRYPIVVSNGDSDYYSGNFRMMFLPMNGREYTKDGAYAYREKVMDFLADKKPKIIKLDDGRVFLSRITNNIQDENDTIKDYVHTSFEWTEIGNTESSEDMYVNGFINVNLEE